MRTRTLTSIDEMHQRSAAAGGRALRVDRRSATGGCSSSSATAGARSPPPTCSASALEYLKSANLTFGQFVPDAKPDRAPDAPAVDVAALVTDYKGDAAGRRRRGLRPDAGEPGGADAAVHAAQRDEGRAAAEEDARRDGRVQPAPAPRRRGVAARHRARRHAGRGDAESRHATARPAGAGRTRSTRLRAKLAFSGGQTGTAAGGETVRAHLADVLRLLPRRCAARRSPHAEFDKLKRELAHPGRAGPDRSAGDRRSARSAATPTRTRSATSATRRRFDEELARLDAATLAAAPGTSTPASSAAGTPSSRVVGDFDADGDRDACHRALRQLEVAVAVRPRAGSVPPDRRRRCCAPRRPTRPTRC